MLGEKVDVTLFLALGSGPWEEFAPDGYRLSALINHLSPMPSSSCNATRSLRSRSHNESQFHERTNFSGIPRNART